MKSAEKRSAEKVKGDKTTDAKHHEIHLTVEKANDGREIVGPESNDNVIRLFATAH